MFAFILALALTGAQTPPPVPDTAVVSITDSQENQMRVQAGCAKLIQATGLDFPEAVQAVSGTHEYVEVCF